MYRHISGVATAEIIISKSKFIGNASYVENEAEAKTFVELIRKKHDDATHNCFAYIFDTLGNAMKFSDDGEPQGTAGIPILEVIRNKKLVQTAVVVTRYFGGIKLGAGGLVRAYTACAVQTLENAKEVTESRCVFFSVVCVYNQFKTLNLSISSMEDVVQQSIDYADMVKISLVTKSESFEDICEKLNNLSNGKCLIKRDSEGYFPFMGK